MKKQWCEVTDNDWKNLLSIKLMYIDYAITNRPKPKPVVVRCPRCNKRMYIHWWNCGDGELGCWHPKVNKHKEK